MGKFQLYLHHLVTKSAIVDRLFLQTLRRKGYMYLLVPFWHKGCEHYEWAIVMEDGVPGHKGYATASREINELDFFAMASPITRFRFD